MKYLREKKGGKKDFSCFTNYISPVYNVYSHLFPIEPKSVTGLQKPQTHRILCQLRVSAFRFGTRLPRELSESLRLFFPVSIQTVLCRVRVVGTTQTDVLRPHLITICPLKDHTLDACSLSALARSQH